MSDGRKVSLNADSRPITVVEAVLATCALQPEFLPVTLDWEPSGPYKYVGSGLRASNPVYHVITEALPASGSLEETWIALLLSLGSGNPGMISFTRSHYSGSNAFREQQQDMAKDERARMTNTEPISDFHCSRSRKEEISMSTLTSLAGRQLKRISTSAIQTRSDESKTVPMPC
jgi:predicted acylesterase/phospholipase RssA